MANSKIAHVNISTARTVVGRACRARIKALLDKVKGEVLADLWQEVCPYPVDEPPERHGILEDLADFAEVLRPRLADMHADELCRLIQRYAVRCRRQRSFVRSLSYGVGGRGPAKVTSPKPISRRLKPMAIATLC